MTYIVRTHQDSKILVCRNLGVLEDAFEFCRLQKPKSFGKSVTRLAQGYQAESLARPFDRLEAITLRPPLVRIRARNPWVLARRILLG